MKINSSFISETSWLVQGNTHGDTYFLSQNDLNGMPNTKPKSNEEKVILTDAAHERTVSFLHY